MPPSPRAELPLDAEMLRSRPLPDDERADKRGRGTVLVVGGSSWTPGAALLAGTAAMRVGAGRLRMATDAAVAPALALAMPESLVAGFDDLDEVVGHIDAVVVGPGLRDAGVAAQLVDRLLDRVPADVPLVLDAVAVTAIADRGPLGARQLVLTPNREELAELVDGEDAARVAAVRFGATVVAFGEVALPDGTVYADGDPVPGLGTSGAGDVLAGAVAGLAARTGDGCRAGCWAALAHRRAAERLAERIAPSGYLARELADELPATLTALMRGG